MTDTLAARVGRIVAGSAHALVDAIEGAMPDAVSICLRALATGGC